LTEPWDIEPEILLDIPVQARSLLRLSRREHALYRRARAVLAAGGGARSLLLADIPLAGLGVYEALLAQSWAVRVSDPQEMTDLARVAVEVAGGFAALGPQRAADLRARALGEMANAYRAADRLRPAEQAFGEAYALLQEGTGDPYLKARLFDLEASLLGTWREFPLALRRLAGLTSLYQDLGEPHLAGRALITRALYTSYSGGTEEALQLNAEGLALIDRDGDPVLYMMAVHNHLLFLVDLGQHAQAKRMLFEHRCHLIYQDGVGALRFRGLEGRISYGLGELVSAEIAFREAKDGLVRAGMSIHVALITLELGMVLLSQGRVEEAEREVNEAREIFLSLEIYRELLGSVLYLEECFRRREATAELMESTIAFLRRRALGIVPQRSR
jgi:tetratricopeptide (TPR) repeat protein